VTLPSIPVNAAELFREKNFYPRNLSGRKNVRDRARKISITASTGQKPTARKSHPAARLPAA
jgi:hypothetical protein